MFDGGCCVFVFLLFFILAGTFCSVLPSFPQCIVHRVLGALAFLFYFCFFRVLGHWWWVFFSVTGISFRWFVFLGSRVRTTGGVHSISSSSWDAAVSSSEKSSPAAAWTLTLCLPPVRRGKRKREGPGCKISDGVEERKKKKEKNRVQVK